MRLGYEDAVCNLPGPIATQGAGELPALLDDLPSRLTGAGGPPALRVRRGGRRSPCSSSRTPASMSPRRSSSARSPSCDRRSRSPARVYGVTYQWDGETEVIARHLEFV